MAMQIVDESTRIDRALTACRDTWHRHIIDGDLDAALTDLEAIDGLLDELLMLRLVQP